MFYVYKKPEESGIVCIEAASAQSAKRIAEDNSLFEHRLVAGINANADQLLKADWIVSYPHEIKVIRKTENLQLGAV